MERSFSRVKSLSYKTVSRSGKYRILLEFIPMIKHTCAPVVNTVAMGSRFLEPNWVVSFPTVVHCNFTHNFSNQFSFPLEVRKSVSHWIQMNPLSLTSWLSRKPRYNLELKSFHKHTKREIGQNPAILASRLVTINNPYFTEVFFLLLD